MLVSAGTASPSLTSKCTCFCQQWADSHSCMRELCAFQLQLLPYVPATTSVTSGCLMQSIFMQTAGQGWLYGRATGEAGDGAQRFAP